jgi:hypothetical protein
MHYVESGQIASFSCWLAAADIAEHFLFRLLEGLLIACAIIAVIFAVRGFFTRKKD